MTTKVEALTDSYDFSPDGDCYAPQIVFTHDRGWNIHELNTDSIPVETDFILELFSEHLRFNLGSGTYPDQVSAERLVRWFRIMFDMEVQYQITRGFSQGDYGISFIFGTPEFYQLTGAPGLSDSDHNDLCAWLWGDVYVAYTEAEYEYDTCNLGHEHPREVKPESDQTIIYGMDEANKFAKENNTEIEGL